MAPAHAEHDAAAAARLAREPRPPPAHPRGVDGARRPRRAQRHPRHRRADWRALRAEKAKLLGFATWADYVLDDQMAKTPANAEQLLTDLVPPATAKARGEAARDPEADRRREGRLQGHRGGLGPLLGEGAQGRVRPRRIGDPALPRSRSRAAGRRLLRRQQDVRHHLQGAQGHPRLPSGRPRLGGLRRRRHARSRCTTAISSCARRKGGGAWCDSFVDQSRLLGYEAGRHEQHQLHQARRGRARAHLLRRTWTRLFHEFGHALHGIFQNVEYPTLGSTPRDFVEFPSRSTSTGPRADGVRQLREALQDRRADAGRSGREDQEDEDVQPGLHHDGVPRLGPPRHGLALAARGRDAAGRRRVREVDARAAEREPARGAASISHDLLLAHLGRRPTPPGYYAYSGARSSTTTPSPGSRRTAA